MVRFLEKKERKKEKSTGIYGSFDEIKVYRNGDNNIGKNEIVMIIYSRKGWKLLFYKSVWIIRGPRVVGGDGLLSYGTGTC